MSIKENETLVKKNRLPQVFYPWRIFLARTFDSSIYRIFWSAFLAFVFHINLTFRNNWKYILDSFIIIAIMLILEPLWLHLFGTTLGKAIFGLRIESDDGKRISYSEGLERTWGVIGKGMGYNIPIYSIVRYWKSYRTCSENEAQPWDESISYTIKDTKWYRNVLYICAYVVTIVILLMIHSVQLLPPNRGELTVAQFVENYNYYAKYYDINFGNKYLDENGEWAENEFDGTFYVQIDRDEMPEFRFNIENGYVQGVSFEVELKNNQKWLRSFDDQMLLASLAFICAQNEMGLFSKLPGSITEQIGNNAFQSFRFTEAGITVICDTEYYGYEAGPMYLYPVENVTGNYFRLSFSMIK